MSKFDLGEKLTGVKLDILIRQNLLQELIRAICSGLTVHPSKQFSCVVCR